MRRNGQGPIKACWEYFPNSNSVGGSMLGTVKDKEKASKQGEAVTKFHHNPGPGDRVSSFESHRSKESMPTGTCMWPWLFYFPTVLGSWAEDGS